MKADKIRPIRVSCAVVICNGKVLAAQRSSSMSLSLKWEFPGGKVKPEETDEECLHRELWEELKIFVRIKRKLTESEYDYGHFRVLLVPFIAIFTGGTMTLVEHQQAKWFHKSELVKLDWAPADVPILQEILEKSF